jgi:hypothetical protein
MYPSAADILLTHSFAMIAPQATLSRSAHLNEQGVIVRNSASFANTRSGFVPAEFQDMVDVAECALDEQLELLQRRHAAASRAAARARFEMELLERRDDIDPNVLEQARRHRAAADTRSQHLLRAIDALEDRLQAPTAEID